MIKATLILLVAMCITTLMIKRLNSHSANFRRFPA